MSGAPRTVKISANQSVFNNTNNLIDIDISESMGTVDLSKSSVLLNVSIDGTISGALTGDDGVPSVQETQMYFVESDTDQSHLIYPSTLVKNAYFKTSKKGMLHSLRRVDTRKYAINNYTKDLEEKKTEHDGFFKGIESELMVGSQFVNYNKLGSVSSTTRTNDFRIPLSEVFDICNTDAFDLEKKGSTRIHLEMNFNKFQPGWSASATPYTQLTYDPRIGGAAVDVFSIVFFNKSVSSNVYTNNPYYVGQKVKIVYNDDGAGDITVHRTIDSISYDSTTLKYTMTFANKIYTGSGAGNVNYTSVNGSIALASASSTINSVQLELQLTDKEDNQKIVYSDWTTEEDFFTSTNSLSKQYVLEGEADNVLICNVIDVLPRAVDVETYRIRVDNNEQTDRDVELFKNEHKDLINRLFNNMDLSIEDMSERAVVVEGGDPQSTPSNTRLYAIGSVLPLKNRPKNLNLNITASTPFDKLILYKRMLKTV